MIKNIDIPIFLILAGFSFCIAFGMSAPSLFINDEWITVNQVNQLSTGSQLIDNEGKYGRTIFGETSEYFKARDNYLAYSIFLPLLSLPAIQLIFWSGELFRLLFLIIWFFCGAGGLLLSIWLLEKTCLKKFVKITWILLLAFFGLFLINLYYYQPFASSFDDSPIESAAVIFTNEMLFALITPMVYSLFRNLSLDRRTSLVGTILVITCSTYLFWSASAKDHLLVAFLLTCIFWTYSSILVRESDLKWFALLTFFGFICWARPEYGFVLLTGLIICQVLLSINIQNHKFFINFKKFKTLLIPGILGIILGLTPFFFNNYVVTGNPFIPPQYLYVTSRGAGISSVISSAVITQNDIISKILSYITQSYTFFSPDIQNYLVDIFGLVLSPSNGGVGLLFICPIILPAILYLSTNFQNCKRYLPKKTRNMLFFSIIMTIFTIIAYLRVIHGSTISPGSLPDMRYFSPLYLPLGIISVLLISPIIKIHPRQWLIYLLISVLIFAPFLVIACTIILPFGITYHMYIYFFMRILILLIILIFILCALKKEIWKSNVIIPLLFGLLVMIPSAFQFLHLIIFSINKSNGYLYWQPILQHLFTNIIVIID